MMTTVVRVTWIAFPFAALDQILATATILMAANALGRGRATFAQLFLYQPSPQLLMSGCIT